MSSGASLPATSPGTDFTIFNTVLGAIITWAQSSALHSDWHSHGATRDLYITFTGDNLKRNAQNLAFSWRYDSTSDSNFTLTDRHFQAHCTMVAFSWR